MNSPLETSDSLRIRRWPWAALIVVCGLLLLFAEMNSRYAAAPHPGFLIHDPEWSAQSDAFPDVWQAFALSNVHEAISAQRPSPIYYAANAVRKETGLRFDNSRWGRWFGPALLVSGRDGQWLASTHPGLLARVAEPLLRELNGWTREGDTVLTADCAYRWHQGYLLFASTPELLGEVSRVEQAAGTSDDAPQLKTSLYGPNQVDMISTFEPGFPVSVKISADSESRPETKISVLHLTPTPWLVIAGIPFVTLDNVWNGALEVVPGGESLKEDWAFATSAVQRTAYTRLYLVGLIQRESQPAPALNLALLSAATGEDVRSFVEEQGEAASKTDSGRGFAVTQYRREGQQLVYTGETRLRPGDNGAQPGSTVTPDSAHIIVNWEAAAGGVTDYLMEETEAGRIGELSQNEFRNEWLPYIDAFRRFGRAVFVGKSVPDGYTFEGMLFPGILESSQ